MIGLIVIQALALLFTIGFVVQQRSCLRMKIDYVPIGTRQGIVFHRGNYIIVCIIVALAFMNSGIYGAAVTGFWYMMLFDPLTTKMHWKNKPWYSLGDEAWHDKIFVRLFGAKAGIGKSVFSALMIAALNYAAYKFPYLLGGWHELVK